MTRNLIRETGWIEAQNGKNMLALPLRSDDPNQTREIPESRVTHITFKYCIIPISRGRSDWWAAFDRHPREWTVNLGFSDDGHHTSAGDLATSPIAMSQSKRALIKWLKERD